MRFPITVLAIALLGSIVPASTFAQTGIGVLDVWLKTRESADAPNDQKVTLYKSSKALVIGMDHYSGAWPQLSNGIKDAEEVAKALAAQGFEVTLKKDLKSEELDRTLKSFFVREGEDVNTRLLLWFSGHGYTVRNEGYIVPVDAPSPKADADFRDKAISLRRFGEYMREANSRHVLAIFDSCFAGTIFSTARSMPPPAITLATTESVREFISSGESDQQVSDDGTFRKLFLDVLAGKEPDADANHDGYITGTELGLFLHQKMTNLTYNRQTPRYGKLNALGYDRGDFVFQVGKPDVPMIPAPPVTQSLSEELKKNQVAAVAPPVAPSAPAVSSAPCSSPITASLSSRPACPLSAAEEGALKPKDIFKECDNCPEMVVVPAGSFIMGSPSSEPERLDREAQVRVAIAKPFAVGKHAVAFDEWDACVADGGCGGYKPSDNDWGRGRRPVINVSWDDAQKYVSWISGKTGKAYRLLSEAEREYVTRAGTATPFWWGSSITPKRANYNGTNTYKGGGSKGEYRQQSVPVDSFAPNPWGLYNVHGNVREWTEDCWNESNNGNPGDGSARSSGDCSRRVLRGGSWVDDPRLIRAALRGADFSVHRTGVVGFRLGRTLSP